MTDCKTCSKCGEVKALTEFYKNTAACKKCTRFAASAYVKANPEKAAAQRAAHYKANRDKYLSAAAAYAKANPEKAAASHTSWVKRNPEKVAAHSAARYAAWIKANPEGEKNRRAVEVAELKPSYLRRLLRTPISQLTPELLALKREQLTLKRATNQLKKEMKNVK